MGIVKEGVMRTSALRSAQFSYQSLNFYVLPNFDTTPIDKEIDYSGTGYTRSSHAFARLLPSSCFCIPYFLRRMALMLMNPAIQLSECYATTKGDSKLYLGQLTGVDGAKIDKAIHG